MDWSSMLPVRVAAGPRGEYGITPPARKRHDMDIPLPFE